jgi:Calcium-activated BK potassium channel alpha subunit/Ion channel
MGIISFMSSLAFVVLTYWDLSQFDECCKKGDPDGKCFPKCNEFFNIRLPKPFMYADKVICGLYLLEYSINLFIS